MPRAPDGLKPCLENSLLCLHREGAITGKQYEAAVEYLRRVVLYQSINNYDIRMHAFSHPIIRETVKTATKDAGPGTVKLWREDYNNIICAVRAAAGIPGLRVLNDVAYAGMMPFLERERGLLRLSLNALVAYFKIENRSKPLTVDQASLT